MTVRAEIRPIDWRCRFGWHPWERWTNGARGEVEFWGGGSMPCWVQMRTCQSCGKLETRKEYP